LIGEIATREDNRNARRTKLGWRFTAKDAHVEPKNRYPSI
jgi:hypothetical protein